MLHCHVSTVAQNGQTKPGFNADIFFIFKISEECPSQFLSINSDVSKFLVVVSPQYKDAKLNMIINGEKEVISILEPEKADIFA